jgi:transposase
VWSVVQVPSPEAEAARQLTREIATVRDDRTRVRNRLQGLLATQGLRLPLNARFVAQLAGAQTGDGRPLPEAWRLRLEHDWTHLATIETRLAALEATRDAQIAAGADRVAQIAQRLCTMRGVAETSAALFSAELFGTRTFANGRQLGAITGLVRSRIAAINGCRTRGSAKRAAARSAGWRFKWRGAGCAGNRPVR